MKRIKVIILMEKGNDIAFSLSADQAAQLIGVLADILADERQGEYAAEASGLCYD